MTDEHDTPPPVPTRPASPGTDPAAGTDTAAGTDPAAVPADRGDRIRSIALGTIVFVATVVVLVGLTRVLEGPAEPPGGAAAASASPSTAPTTNITPTATPGGASQTPAASPTASVEAGGGTPGPSAPTPTPPTAIVDPVLVGAGDIADCGLPGDEATAALLDSIDGTVFTAGDNAYPIGSVDDFRDCYGPTWGRHLARTRPAPGNHDWATADLAGYLGYFGDAAAPDGASWYSYDLGTWHVIVLDSNCDRVDGCGPDSPQGRWLAADLAASDARCTMAIWHHPRWSSGEHGDSPDVAPFWRALHDADVDVVVNGHDHDYERFAPQDPEGREDRARGIREFVVGTGGAVLRDFPRVAPNSELRASLTHGVLAFTLRDGGYDWGFVPTTTDFTDRGTASCH